jgi:hypothetical protein
MENGDKAETEAERLARRAAGKGNRPAASWRRTPPRVMPSNFSRTARPNRPGAPPRSRFTPARPLRKDKEEMEARRLGVVQMLATSLAKADQLEIQLN